MVLLYSSYADCLLTHFLRTTLPIISKFPITTKSKQSSLREKTRILKRCDLSKPYHSLIQDKSNILAISGLKTVVRIYTSSVSFSSGRASKVQVSQQRRADTTSIISRSGKTPEEKCQWANKAELQLNSQSAPTPASLKGLHWDTRAQPQNTKSSNNKVQALSHLFHEGFSSFKG